MEEPVRLKDCHKTDEMCLVEKKQKLRAGLTSDMIQEYLLIKAKKSELPRAKRDYIAHRITMYYNIGAMTTEEMYLIQPNK